MSELISIVMTSYNYSDYISEAIESVINQTYKNWELIIIDDASEDNSVEIINSYCKIDSRIKVYVNDYNKGLAPSLLIGVNKCRGNWIAFLESDDYFSIENLNIKSKYFTAGADAIFSDVQLFGEQTLFKKYEDHFVRLREKKYLPDHTQMLVNFKENIRQLNIVPTFSSILIKKSLILSCSFNSPVKECLDYYLWAQIANNNIFYINKKLIYWRIHSDSYINQCCHNGIKHLLFKDCIYWMTLKHDNYIVKLFKFLNYIRKKIFYFHFSKSEVKISLFDKKIILKK